MKSRLLKLTIVVLVTFGFTACLIEGPSVPPDYTKPGKTMFEDANFNISLYSNLLDKLLRMDTYIRTADSEKQNVEDTYFVKFKIRTKDNKTWYLVNSGDTIYTINSDSKPFSSLGSKFTIKLIHYDPVTFENKGNNQWTVKAENIHLPDSIIATELNFNCTSGFLPKSFESADFDITGHTKFQQQHNSQITFMCTITKSFKHAKGKSFCIYYTGACSLTANDNKTLEEGSAQAEFDDLSSDTMKLKVVYRGRTKEYTEYYYKYDFDSGYVNYSSY